MVSVVEKNDESGRIATENLPGSQVRVLAGPPRPVEIIMFLALTPEAGFPWLSL